MRTLSIDIETYSSEDLTKSGVYRYAEAPDFAILLFGFAYDDDPVTVIDLAQEEELPDGILEALMDENILKTAWNAAFEITCISSYFNLDLDVTQWECSMVKSAMLGLPLSLDMASKVLQLPEEKMKAGKALIRYFSVPCKPTKVNQGRTRNLPHHDIDKWNLYKEYNGMDVEVERAIRRKIAFFDIPEKERQLWYLDQKINKRGVALDLSFVESALYINDICTDELLAEAKDITGLDNPNSAAQLKSWLSEEMSEEITSLKKNDIPDMIDRADDEKVKRLLELRQQLSKTSIKKYIAMLNSVCKDGRIRGLTQFYGANRTGRFAGRIVQLQNLVRNLLKDLELARELVYNREYDILNLTFGNISDVLSQLIRTAFIASNGHRLYVADFSAIEARVLAWWAKEKWRLDVFKTHGMIYEASASAMFGVPLEKVTKDLRGRGKVAELALGYQGAVGALKAMDIKKELIEEEMPRIVKAWRKSNKNIVQLWYTVEKAVIITIKEGKPNTVNGVTFYMRKGILFAKLPSGRSLAYPQPRVIQKQTAFGTKESIQYKGLDDKNKWGDTDSYGGKFVENITQAIARDCLCESMLRLEEANYPLVFHVHDEGIGDIIEGFGSIGEMCEIMSRPMPWAPDLPLNAEGYVTDFYKKD